MLDIQNNGSCRGGSRNLATFKIKLFATLVKCSNINFSTKSFILDVAYVYSTFN